MDPKIQELKIKISELEKEIKQSQKGSERLKQIDTYEPEKTIFEWQSLSRVFKQRDKVWFLKVSIIALLFILFFAFLQDFIVIIVICVIVLISFLLGSIPPTTVKHKITNKGIFSINDLYKWKDLKKFYLAEKIGQKILYIETKIPFVSRLVILINNNEEFRIVKLLSEKLDYKEIEGKQGWISKISDGDFVEPKRYLHIVKVNTKPAPPQQDIIKK
jgi:hypothetical protein